MARRGTPLTEQNVDYTISLSYEEKEDAVVAIDGDCICHTINGKPIKPKTLGQKTYVDAIRKKMIAFGVGPAGTGKTYLAMAMAITAFKSEEVSRIILTRPAIEAGEKLGFLPGDLQSKIDPYLGRFMMRFMKSWALTVLLRIPRKVLSKSHLSHT